MVLTLYIIRQTLSLLPTQLYVDVIYLFIYYTHFISLAQLMWHLQIVVKYQTE